MVPLLQTGDTLSWGPSTSAPDETRGCETKRACFPLELACGFPLGLTGGEQGNPLAPAGVQHSRLTQAAPRATELAAPTLLPGGLFQGHGWRVVAQARGTAEHGDPQADRPLTHSPGRPTPSCQGCEGNGTVPWDAASMGVV